MIDLPKLTETDVGRRVQWIAGYLHEGYLATWDSRLLIVDEEAIGGCGKKTLRVFVDPKEADLVEEEK